MDFNRPLNERGRRDAPAMAEKLKGKEVVIDCIISSTATRALQTAHCFAAVYDIPQTKIVQLPSLYHAPVHDFYEAISKIPDKFSSVALFSHNPGITDFINKLTTTHIDNMPTCAVFAVKADLDEWKLFEESNHSFWFFDYPKL